MSNSIANTTDFILTYVIVFAGVILGVRIFAQALDKRISFMTKVQDAMEEGDLGKAMSLVDKFAAQYPRDPNVTFYRGRIYAMQGKLKEALSEFTKSIETASEHISPAIRDAHKVACLGARGKAKEQSGDYEGALADYAESIRVNPDVPWDNYNRAELLKRLGRFDEAIAAYSESISTIEGMEELREYARKGRTLSREDKAVLKAGNELVESMAVNVVELTLRKAAKDCGESLTEEQFVTKVEASLQTLIQKHDWKLPEGVMIAGLTSELRHLLAEIPAEKRSSEEQRTALIQHIIRRVLDLPGDGDKSGDEVGI